MKRSSPPHERGQARGHGKTRRRRLTFLVLTLASAFTLVSAAQTKKPGAKAPAAAPAKKAPAKPSADDSDAAAVPLSAKETTEPVAAAKDAGKGGSVVDQKMLDGGQRVFRFGEVEVEGRLKSPQIVYFLRRVRAEFAAGDLGHRSFMRELGETKNEPSF
jgi:hypothetical protein